MRRPEVSRLHGNMKSSAAAITIAVALAGVGNPVGADTLTAEQRALVEKYGISEADQQKLFAKPAVAKKPAAAKKPVVAPAEEPVQLTEVAAPGFLAGTYIFSGFETYKSIGDRLTNINGGTGSLTGSFGAVVGFNSGHTLTESNFGIQAGASYGLYDFKGRLRVVPEDTAMETHAYYTVGIYKRASTPDADAALADRLSMGLVFDSLHAENWGINANTITLSQLRGTLGYALSDSTEIGVWATHGLDTDQAAVTVAGAPGVRREIRAVDQTNLYVKHNFDFGGDVTAYVGVFDSSSIGEWQLGLSAKVPLSPDWALYGSANYVVPDSGSGANGSGEEQFSLSLGLAYHFGGNARSADVAGSRHLPLQDVASSRTFLITD